MLGFRAASSNDAKHPQHQGELVVEVGGVLWGVDTLERACKEVRELHAEVQRQVKTEPIKPGTVNGATVGPWDTPTPHGATPTPHGATPTPDEPTQAQKDIKTLRGYLGPSSRLPTDVAAAITRLDEMTDALAKDGLPLKNAKRIIYELRSELNAARSETGARADYLLKKLRGDIDMFLRNR